MGKHALAPILCQKNKIWMIRLPDSILVLHLGNVESSFKQKKIHRLQLLGVFEDTYNVGYFSAIKLSRSVQLLLICSAIANMSVK